MEAGLAEVKANLEVLFNSAGTLAQDRNSAESYLLAASLEWGGFAAAALKSQHVREDSALCWWLILALHKHLESHYWGMTSEEKDSTKQVRDALQHAPVMCRCSWLRDT